MTRLLLRLPPALATLLIGLAIALSLTLAVLLLRPVIGPLVAAAILYVFLAPAVEALQRRGVGHTLAVTVVLGGTLLSILWAAINLAPPLGEQLSGFLHRLPSTWNRLEGLIDDLVARAQYHLGVDLPVAEFMNRLRHWLERRATDWLSQGSEWIAQTILWALLLPLTAFFLLRDFRRLRNALLDRVPNAAFEDVLRIYHGVGSRLQSYLRGVLIQSSVIALIVTSGLTLVGLPLAPLLGVIAGLLNLIPYLGPLLAALPPLLVGLSTGLETPHLGLVALVLITAQVVDNLVVVPLVLARAANLHPLAALLGVILAGQAFGVWGMILALPALASARICLEGIHEGLSRRRTQVTPPHADIRATHPNRPLNP